MDEFNIMLSDILKISDDELEEMGICNVYIHKHSMIFLDIHRAIHRDNGISIEDFDYKMEIILENDLQIKKPDFLHGSYCKSDENAGKILQVKRLENESAEKLYIAGTRDLKRFGYASRSDLVYMICGYDLLQKTHEICKDKGFLTMEFLFQYIDFDTKEIKEQKFEVPFYEKDGKQPIVFLPTEYCTTGDIGHNNKKKLLKLLDDEDIRNEIIRNDELHGGREFLLQMSDHKTAKEIEKLLKELKFNNNELYNFIQSVIYKSDTYNQMVDQSIKSRLKREI